MPSVDNLYWVLYQLLLKPLSISCFFYHPFGTQDHLLLLEFDKIYDKPQLNHVLFHFDQEPIVQDNLGVYEQEEVAWLFKHARFLANSEHSDLKSRMVVERQMLDWYFFYHGLAALDWYRDTQYIVEDKNINHAYLSLNHVTSPPRHYRLDLIARLIEKNIQHKGLISLHATGHDIVNAIQNPHSKLSDSSKLRISQQLARSHDLPWTVDSVSVDGSLSARCGHKEFKLWQSSLLHVVNETVFYDQKLHLTEKIFKPIVSKRPFVLVAAPGNLAYLRSYGFQTFDNWIDESYDDIEDNDLRLAAITEQIEKISSLTVKQMQDLKQDMQLVLDFNKQHFFTDFRRIIVNELVDNFETCVRIWNNGRVDGRQIPFVIDTTRAKTVLLS